MTDVEVQATVDRLVDAEKKGHGQGAKVYGKTYVEINAQVAKIRPHADENYLPVELINKRAPNATDDQVKYIRENWKATTIPVFQELLTIINRGFIDDNWKILWKDDSEDFREYCEDYFPEYGSIESLVKEVIPPLKYVDPNAIVAVRPRGFHYVKDSEGEYVRNADGLPVLDDTKHVEPAVYFHMSDKVLIRETHFILAVANEHSLVEFGGKTVKEGRVLYAYTPNDIYKVEQYGKKVDNTYKTFLYYNHNEGVLPCTELRGIPKKTFDGGLIQVSPYRYATDLLDLALTNKNWLQLSVSSVVFPFKIMMADPCTFATDLGRCNSGAWVSNKTGLHEGSCSKCNGKGVNTPYSPLGTYLWEKPEGGLDKGGSMPRPVEFVEAPTGSLDFVQRLVDKDTKEAKSILHLVNPNEETNGSQNKVATIAVMNDQGQISFVRYNVHQIFNLWDWILKRVAFQRYEKDPYAKVPTLVYPQTFDFRSEADIWNEIKIAREAEAPVSIIQDLFRSLLNNIHSSSPDSAKIFDTITNADKLFALSDIALASRKASGTVQDWETVLHDSALQLVNELILDDPKYLDKDLKERIDLLIKLSKSSTFEVIKPNPVADILANN